MSKQTYPQVATIFDLPDTATATDIRKACRDLVSHPGKFQALSPEEAYYWMLSSEYSEPVMTVEPDDFEIWRSGTLAFACVTDDLGFAAVRRFNMEDKGSHFSVLDAAKAWVESYYDDDNAEMDDFNANLGSHIDPADMEA